VHKAGSQFAIEVRPRAGTWAPFIAAVPVGEGERVKLHLMHGAAGRLPNGGVMMNVSEGTTPDGRLAYVAAGMEATPTMSFYIYCAELPSHLIFGVEGRQPQFTIDPRKYL
jgi:hypothetical protein